MSDNVALEIKDLTKWYDGLLAVNSLSMTVKKREIHALIGPNGAGKTTTLSMINGTIPSSEGSVTFYGEDISNQPTHKIARLGMARTFQNIKLFGTLTLLENLMVAGHQEYTKGGLLRYLFRIKESNAFERQLKEQAEEVLNYIGMYSLRNEVVSNLPYGRQKVAELARAMMIKPKLILLDEPAAGLNPSERTELVDNLLRIYDDGVDLFLIEHNMDVVMNMSHMITVLNFGTKIAQGVPSDIQKNPDVIKAYLGDRYQPVNI